MVELTKLRRRLSNVNKNITEYRMTIQEATALLAEIDIILTSVKPLKDGVAAVEQPKRMPKIMDGGSF